MYSPPICPTEVDWTPEGRERLLMTRKRYASFDDPIYTEEQMQDMQCQQDSDDAQ